MSKNIAGKTFENQNMPIVGQVIALGVIVLLIIGRAHFSLNAIEDEFLFQLVLVICIDVLIGAFASIFFAKPNKVLFISILALITLFFMVAPFLYLIVPLRLVRIFIPLYHSIECAAVLFGISLSQVIFVHVKKHKMRKNL